MGFFLEAELKLRMVFGSVINEMCFIPGNYFHWMLEPVLDIGKAIKTMIIFLLSRRFRYSGLHSSTRSLQIFIFSIRLQDQVIFQELRLMKRIPVNILHSRILWELALFWVEIG